MEKRLLLIDGNYFAHRAIHGLRISQPDFNLTTVQQMNNFESLLNDSFINLFKSFNNSYHELLENIVFVFDNKSWRKSIEPIKPYYINDNTKLGYKDNRKEQKEESDIDYDNFNLTIENFRNKIKSQVPIIHFDGGEGDDALLLLTNKFSEQNIETIIFATDGDLKFLVNKNVILLKNTKSKELPDGEFIISGYLHSKLFAEKSMLEKFTQTNLDTQFYDLLFAIDVANGGTVKSTKNRKLNSGIAITNKYTNLLIKVICGDAKDNIFPLYRWRNPKDTMNMKVTEIMIKKAFEMSLYDFDEKTVKEAFSDGKLMAQILINLKTVTKQSNVELKQIVEHYQHNLRMNKLHIECLPEYVVKNFNSCYDDNLSLINKRLELETLLKMNLKVHQNDNAKELMVSSIVSDDNSKEVINENQSIIDDILGI